MMDDIYRQIAKGYCVFDLETTGLSPLNDVIIEVAARKVLPDDVPRDREWLVNITPRTIPDNIVALTGITDADLQKTGVSIRQALVQLKAFVSGLPMVGHNVLRFDRPFLAAAGYGEYDQLPTWPAWDFIDTAALFKGFKMGWEMPPGESHTVWAGKVFDARRTGLKYRLDVACHELGVGNRDRTEHRAMPDVVRAQALFEKLLDIWTQTPGGLRTPEAVLSLPEGEAEADMAVKW